MASFRVMGMGGRTDLKLKCDVVTYSTDGANASMQITKTFSDNDVNVVSQSGIHRYTQGSTDFGAIVRLNYSSSWILTALDDIYDVNTSTKYASGSTIATWLYNQTREFHLAKDY